MSEPTPDEACDLCCMDRDDTDPPLTPHTAKDGSVARLCAGCVAEMGELIPTIPEVEYGGMDGSFILWCKDRAAAEQLVAEHPQYGPVRVVRSLAEDDARTAELGRHRNANLIRAVRRGAEPEWITDAINAEDFDRIPWRISDELVKKLADATARIAELEAGIKRALDHLGDVEAWPARSGAMRVRTSEVLRALSMKGRSPDEPDRT